MLLLAQEDASHGSHRPEDSLLVLEREGRAEDLPSDQQPLPTSPTPPRERYPAEEGLAPEDEKQFPVLAPSAPLLTGPRIWLLLVSQILPALGVVLADSWPGRGAFSVPGLERQLPSPLPPRSPASFAPRSNRGGKRVCRAALPRREGRDICPRSRSKSSPLPTIAPELHQKKGKRGTWAPVAGRVPRTLSQACFQHSPQLASFWLEATSGFRRANRALEVSALFLFSSPPQLLLLTCLFPSSLYPLHLSPFPA